jgi:hypothetical protein
MDTSHKSAVLVHLANIACRTGNRQLMFDGDKESFPDNDDANRLLKDTYRENYAVPEKV